MTHDAPLYRSRYPGYDVLGQQGDWDDVTRDVVLKRVHEVPPLRFFTEAEAATLRAFADTLLPQDDRPDELRIPLVNYLDERLHAGKGDGWRDERLPPDPELWRTLAAALDDEARRGFGATGYANLETANRRAIVGRLRDEAVRQTLEGGGESDYGGRPLMHEGAGWASPEPSAKRPESPLWGRIPLRWSFPILLFEFVTHYYGHPYAWNEIGFGGPKFPRIYARTLRPNREEALEVDPHGTP